MRTFFQAKTSPKLYKHLSERSVGDQDIRQTDKQHRLLANENLLDETKAQNEIRDVEQRVRGFDISQEYEIQYADDGVVIAPLSDAFKDELATATVMRFS